MLRSKLKDEEAFKDKQIKKLKRKVGELVLNIDIYKESMKLYFFGQKVSKDLDKSRVSRNVEYADFLNP